MMAMTPPGVSRSGGDDGEDTETVMVTATDPSGASATQSVTITINDVNDAPKFAKYAPAASPTQDNNATALTVEENTLVLDRDADTDDAQDPTYQATDADAGDAATTAATATPPTVALTYEVTGPDASAFVSPIVPATVDGTDGVATLAFKSDHKVNYEGKDEYEITIVASDDSAPEGTGTVDVTITVINAEDMGVVTPTQREPQVGKEVVAALSDQDGNIRGQKWQWYRHVAVDDPDTTGTDESDVSGVTAVCGADGVAADATCMIRGATSPNYTPTMADLAPLDETTQDDLTDRQDRRLAARVTYTDAHVTDGADEGTADDGDSMQLVLQAPVEVEDPANAAPKFRDDQDANTPGDQADASRSVSENAKGEAVGDPVTASDPGRPADLLAERG